VLAPPPRGHRPRTQVARFGQALEGPRAGTGGRSGDGHLSAPAAFESNSQVKPLRGACNALPLGSFSGTRATYLGAPLHLKPSTSPCASEPPPKTPAPDTRLHRGPVASEHLVLRRACGVPSRAAPPNPSLKRRPAPAGRLARAAPVVHHAPHGQAGPPPRSA
jgi:hypothetical protein